MAMTKSLGYQETMTKALGRECIVVGHEGGGEKHTCLASGGALGLLGQAPGMLC